ncbi:MAG TPA: TonB-dependent receptor [Terriglobia bacterium]|nr:TonB-dependent receptor [Terriglobia bacterium]
MAGVGQQQSAPPIVVEQKIVSTTGMVVAAVRGPGDVSVPGATVTLTESTTGERKQTWTDQAGNCTLTGVKPGVYKVEASLVGFQTEVRESVTVTAGETNRVSLVLRMATPTEASQKARTEKTQAPPKPEASAEPGQTDTHNLPSESAMAAGEVGEESAASGGSVRFSEGAGNTGASQEDNSGGDSESADSSASAENSFLLAGGVGQAPTPGEPGRRTQEPKELRKAVKRTPGAGGFGGRNEFGGEGGGFGTAGAKYLQINRVRGNIVEQYSNSAYNARPYALNASPAPQIAYDQERVAASIGGPLSIPGISSGKDKTSFFLHYQLQRGRNPFSSYSTVPTLAERSGDFSQAVIPSGPNAGTVPTIYDPMSNSAGPRTPFSGNMIPTTRFSSAATGLLQYLPTPNLTGSVQNFRLQESLPANNDRAIARIDRRISGKDNLTGSYYFNSARSIAVSNFAELTQSNSTRSQNLNLGETHTFSPHVVNTLTAIFNRQRAQLLNPFAFKQNISNQLGIQGVSGDPFDWGLPLIAFTNYTGLNDAIPSLTRNQTLRILDSILWSRGKHNVRFGGELRRVQINTSTDPDARGTFNFTGYSTSDFTAKGRPVAGTGLDFADFLLGLPQVTSERFGIRSNYLRSGVYAGFVQDDWRAGSRLTFNFGLRYEYFPRFVEKYGHLSDYLLGPGFSSVSVVTSQSPDGLPAPLIKSDPYLFAPRFGAAFRPWSQHSFVMRAGYGIFYDGSIYRRLVPNLVDQPPFAQAATLITSPAEVLTLENGFPSVAPRSGKNTYAVDPNFRVPYGQTWNLTLEDQIFHNVILSVGYVGTKGTKLDLLLAPNEAITGQPALKGLQFRYETDGATSVYQGMQVNLRRQLNHGLGFGVYYAYSKSIDNASTIGGVGGAVAQDLYNLEAERGLSVFDTRHRLLVNWTYEFPFGGRRRWLNRGGALAGMLGDWQISGYGQVQSGTPFTAQLLGNQGINASGAAFFSERADATGAPAALPSVDRTTLQYFNTAAFILPPSGTFGNAGRNTIPGPGLTNFNMSLDRFVTLSREKGRRLDFRVSANNVFNTPNFSGLWTVVNAVTFGRVTSVKSMRALDFSVRLRF